ncbi:Cysteine-rich secretory protein family protein [Botrimarina colliarenosi]|uniref:Cysteine-rich secretory protein family protein n=1 Tax=Botrimarina colliarenosi TaxID=2528001 RepID=A0A5C6AM54_9BACT|nr:CAP domain-containing protein [Botrimarina colliarenosi]TWU00501.1 Cysteine-rich secretory protein family protein [Botrimarina colliarenosi]
MPSKRSVAACLPIAWLSVACSLIVFLSARPADAALLSVDTADRQAAVAFYHSQYASGVGTRLEWITGTAPCDPGYTTATYQNAVLDRVNYFRAMAGVPAVTLNATYTRKAQAAAYLMGVNARSSHAPDASWTCYSQDAYDGASRSNLFLYQSGLEAIDGYVRDDGPHNGAIGHRRWILHPPTKQIGVGDVPAGVTRESANALYVIDNGFSGAQPAARDGFVAWPPPGYVPYDVAYPRWHFSQQGVDLSAASVSLTLNGQSVPVQVESRGAEYNLGYIGWRVNNMANSESFPRPTADQPYRVTIQNARIGGVAQSIAYEVTLIDPGVTIPGDANFDGVVDAADYTAIRDGIGTEFTAADLLTWRFAYGNRTAEPAATAPEPTAAGLLLAALAAAPAWGRVGSRRPPFRPRRFELR